MSRYSLTPHPDHPPLGVRGVTVDLRMIDGGAMLLNYVVDGAETAVWPERTSAVRSDGLWRTTCFELFLMFDDEEHYVEFNFSPSSAWAAYAFDGYRDGMAELSRDLVPHVTRIRQGVEVDCDLGGLPHGELLMSLTAVIEEEGGRRSFWALAHPPGAPDFHHRDCFTARLPAPAQP
ncbi:DOMON-like domain-containing protein [Sphingomonas sp. HHU CXW]|uniref:DOMON-like domain-containing protein n=1 Tax=Sphingomonas hominis TaxID=2741495 RepID=A0ABX2JFI0_9SPHN|nr:DOMON-like domain-containing protein [Sphingomonas hominis]NTS64414.1 DOMON-like domain-containing protein [Sphingomonas hominis]